ncbi:TROVE domain containing protein [Asbolus verrucosus]|uniref:TROVE domain containing protein n=1 Tax=Asbolus verrucosus TaxID=1661398 RepID=A0A482VNY4_ASBVE|nr:TROVE domain containing protein [Asbolus verrucosus]
MGSQEVTFEDKLKRFLYTNNYHGVYITGNPEKHFCKLADSLLFQWMRVAPESFISILTAANDDPLLVRRANLFYIMAEALQEDLDATVKASIKETVFKLLKSDEEFFDFVKYFTIKRTPKQKISTCLKKMILKFYHAKQPLEFARTVTKQESHHGWSHKDLIKLCHLKGENVSSEYIIKYVLFGVKELPERNVPATLETTIDLLRKAHLLRTTEDVKRAVELVKELHANIDQVNSKLNRNEEVWSTIVAEMTTREVLQCLYKFYKLGFLKSGSQFQGIVIEALTNADKIKKCNLHPVEVFIYLKFFEKGGKTVDPKLLEYLQKHEVREDTLKRLTTPSEPKCKAIVQNVNKCLKLSYNNVQPTGKRFMVTVDVTDKTDVHCFHNKRISCLEATHAIIRYLSRVEKNVTVAVFKDNQINFVDLSKSHTAIEKLKEHKAAYIVPSAPIEWAKNKKKQIDVFINFMSCNWFSHVPQEVREKMEKLPDVLSKYSKKMKAPETKLVKIFFGGTSAAVSDGSRNILTIAGLSVDVPRVLEAFCRGHFC